MKSILMAGMVAAAFGCMTLAAPSASAAPVSANAIEQPASGVAQTQMRRDRRMMRRSMMRRPMMRRGGMDRRMMRRR